MTVPVPSQEVREAALVKMTSWVAAIADKVNNPVASVLAGLSAVQRELSRNGTDGPVDAALVSDYLDRIKGRLTSLAEYVQELQTFGLPEELNPVVVSLETAVATVLLECETRGEICGEIEVDLMTPVVFADYVRLKSVLRALILNGWEAAARQEVRTVRVTARSVLGGTEISVEDNGPGFLTSIMDRAAEPFFSTKEAGTGLGLAIVKKFVGSHAGSLSLGSSSALGGAKVSIVLPTPKLEVKS